MINITNSAIVEKIKGTGRTFTLSIKVGTNTFTKVKSLRRSSIFASNQKLSVGEAVSAFIEAEINDCRESLQNYEVEPILSIDGYNIPLGIFKVQAPSQADGSGTQKITAYDRMSETSKFTYTATGLTSATATFSAICNICGFTAITSGLTDVAINDRLLDGMTCREALGYVAGVFGKNCVVTTDGRFKMLGYSKVAESTCKISINSLDTLEFPSKVSTVDYFNAVVDEATTYKSGTGSNGVNVVNPLFKSTSQTYSILSQLQANVGSNGYYPAKFKQLNGDPRIEVGDVVLVEHRNILTGETTADYVPVMSLVLDYDGGVTVSIEAYATESEFSMSLSDKMNITNSSNNAKFEDLAGDIDDAKDAADGANTKADFAVVQSAAVEELNKVIGNSLGLYQTKIKGTGGDEKYYFHNKPTLESSTYIISMTDQGFAFANSWNNGSPVWTYGINPAGNSIMNYLVVNKISADLIEAGVIKSLDGSPLKTEFSLNTGLFSLEAQANKETFGFGINRHNDLMLQYNYSDGDKFGVKLGYYYGGYFYKDAKHTEIIPPSTEYYYGDIPNDSFYEYSSGRYQKITDLTQVARTQKGFVMHSKGITIGYTVDEDGKVYSDFNLNQNAAGGNLGVIETDNTEARTPMLKYYDFENEPSNGSEHYTAIRKQSIVTKYFGAEKIAFLFENNLYDLEYLMKYLALSNNTLNEKVSILETEVARLKETLGTKSLIVYASANPSTAGVVGGSGSYTLEDKNVIISAYPASGTEYYISSVSLTYASGSSETVDQATLINRGWLTNGEKRLDMAIPISASMLDDTLDVVVNFGLPTRYNLTLNVDPTGSGTVTGSGIYEPDSYVTIRAVANSGWKFAGWYENGSLVYPAINDTINIYLTSDRTLTAKFEAEEIEVPKFTISTSVSPSGAGTVTGGGVYEKDTRQTVTATPASGYTFKHWLVTLTDSGSTTIIEDNPCSFTVTYNASFKAVFEAVSSGELTIVAGETKSVDINAGKITYLKFTPSTSGNYEFTSLGTSDDDVVGYLYDANKSQIATDDDTAGNRQFLITQQLTAGTIYYWGVKYYNTAKTGSVNVKLTYKDSGGGSGDTTESTRAILTNASNSASYGDEVYFSSNENGTDNLGTEEVYTEDKPYGNYAIAKCGSGRKLSKVEIYYDGVLGQSFFPDSSGTVSLGTLGYASGISLIEVKCYFDSAGGDTIAGTKVIVVNGSNSASYGDEVYFSTNEQGTDNLGTEIVLTIDNPNIYMIAKCGSGRKTTSLDLYNNGEFVTSGEISDVAGVYSGSWGYVDDTSTFKFVIYFDWASGGDVSYAEDTIVDGVLYIGTNTTTIASAAYYQNSDITSVIIPEGVTRIGAFAFSECSSLVSVKISNTVTHLSGSAFEESQKLKTVTIGSGLTFIGSDAFSGCEALSDVYYSGTQEQWNSIEKYDTTITKATIHYNSQGQ